MIGLSVPYVLRRGYAPVPGNGNGMLLSCRPQRSLFHQRLVTLSARHGSDNPRMTERISSPVFVGRSEERLRLQAALDGAMAGTVGATLIGGEAGVGKSRLL